MDPKIITFGCRLNSYESEIMRLKAKEAGINELKEEVIIFNTCAVTAEAVRQAKQAIRKAARQQPNARIIVSGCAAQINAEQFAAMAEVDLVLGNQEKLDSRFYRNLPDFAPALRQKIWVNDIMQLKELAPHMVQSFYGKSRAFVEIQNGCDHRCTFCIIPYSRGPSRSVAMGALIEQIKQLCAKGYVEIILTGVDITSYGQDLPGQPKLSDLIKSILRHVPQILRLRLSSIDSIEIDSELFELLCYEKKIMPYLHLSLQSGADLILKRMKRRHLRKDAIEFCQNLKLKRPEMVFGADLIAGFPTESEEMFKDSLALIDECDLTHLHVFPFSPRQGTPAARMPQLDKVLIKQRAKALRHRGEERYARHLQNSLYKYSNILLEHDDIARAEDYTLVKIDSSINIDNIKLKDLNNQQVDRAITNHIGQVHKAYIYGYEQDKLLGRLL